MSTEDLRPLRAPRTEPLRETSYVYTPPSHRLLFRGSLSVPDSRICLEGLTFTVPLDKTTKLLDNPLALALESMRGRMLALIGTTPLDAVHLDMTTDVSVDIHPAASLTQLYFGNQLCAKPITSAAATTDVGIRITLGDPGTESASEILIYGKLPDSPADPPPDPSSSTSSAPPPPPPPPTLRLLAARILPAPAPPRPDDPLPRMPPLVSFGKKRVPSDSLSIRPASAAYKRQKNEDGMVRRAREIMQHGPLAATVAEAGARVRVGLSRANSMRVDDDGGEDAFKVPMLPSAAGREKSRAAVPDIVRELEKANKATVKRGVIDCLAAYDIVKEHAEFKDVYNYIYRGTEFALRMQMQTRAVDARAAEKFARAHAEMYVNGVVPGSTRGGTRGSQNEESQIFDDG